MKALMLASVASMIDQFNMENIALLQELGYEVHVVCNFENGNTSSQERVKAFRKELEKINVTSISYPIPRKISAISDIIQSYKLVRKLVKEQQYDIVHCQSPIGGVITRLACKGQRKRELKLVYTAHGFHFYTGASKLNWMIFYPIEKYLAKYTDVLITICKEDYMRAKKFIPAKHVVYTPGVGIQVEKLQELPCDLKKREEIGIKPEEKVIYSIGELNTNKNHETIIHAMAQLERQDVHYVVCGQGNQMEHLREIAKELGVENNVHLLGFRTDAKEWLKCADIFAFPSYREGLPVSLMEAMAEGLPVVCSRIRGNVDLIEEGKGGYMYAANDIEGFTNGLTRLLENEKEREAFALFNQKKVENFSRKQVQRIMKRVYGNLQ